MALTAVSDPKQPINQSAEPVHCAICGPGHARPWGRSNGTLIMQCANCGLYHVEQRARTADVSEFYRADYIADTNRAETEMIGFRAASLRREAARINRLQPDGGRLLDVGASSGTFLHQFSELNHWHVEGVEPSAFAVKYARERFGLTIHQGFLHDQHFDSNSFDCVTSLDTFMLHPEPAADLQEMARILKPGGMLAMEIPGLRFRMLKNSGPVCRVLYGVPISLNAGVHLYYYTRRTLTRLMEQHGFEFARSWAEQMPESGNAVSQFGKWAYFRATDLAYRLTSGWCHVAPKEFIVFKKARSNS